MQRVRKPPYYCAPYYGGADLGNTMAISTPQTMADHQRKRWEPGFRPTPTRCPLERFFVWIQVLHFDRRTIEFLRIECRPLSQFLGSRLGRFRVRPWIIDHLVTLRRFHRARLGLFVLYDDVHLISNWEQYPTNRLHCVSR